MVSPVMVRVLVMVTSASSWYTPLPKLPEILVSFVTLVSSASAWAGSSDSAMTSAIRIDIKRLFIFTPPFRSA